jgi:hypothetical protein
MPVCGMAFIQQNAAAQLRLVSRALFDNRYGASRVDMRRFGSILRIADHQIIIQTHRCGPACPWLPRTAAPVANLLEVVERDWPTLRSIHGIRPQHF